MEPRSRAWMAPPASRLLAGLEVGIWGGFAMLSWIALGSALSDRSVWTVPNLLSLLLYRPESFRSGFSAATLPGLALHLFTSGIVGIAFGLLVREPRSRVRVRLLGLVVGLVWYYLSNDLFWRKVGPVIGVYAPPPMMLMGHLIFGIVLGWYPSSLDSVRRHLLGEPAAIAAEAPAAPAEP